MAHHAGRLQLGHEGEAIGWEGWAGHDPATGEAFVVFTTTCSDGLALFSALAVLGPGVQELADLFDRQAGPAAAHVPGVAVPYRGSGSGPVAVTRRCGTQSSTWWKPSNRPPCCSTPARSESR